MVVDLHPPYLLTAGPEMSGASLGVIGDPSAATVEIAVRGPWSPQLHQQVSDALRLCLAGPSTSIIADLRDLSDPHGESLPFWLAVWQRARLETSPVQLALSLPATTGLSRRLRRWEEPRPRVFDSVPEARSAVAEQTATADRREARMEPRPASVRAARHLVGQACHAWSRPESEPDAALIVSELASNAVEHARTDFVVTLTRDGARLQIAVRDGAPGFPPAHPLAVRSPLVSLTDRGRGLRLVHAVAAAWGAMPARDGKVVWATLAGPPDARHRAGAGPAGSLEG